jgi:hypothetical protein
VGTVYFFGDMVGDIGLVVQRHPVDAADSGLACGSRNAVVGCSTGTCGNWAAVWSVASGDRDLVARNLAEFFGE